MTQQMKDPQTTYNYSGHILFEICHLLYLMMMMMMMFDQIPKCTQWHRKCAHRSLSAYLVGNNKIILALIHVLKYISDIQDAHRDVR